MEKQSTISEGAKEFLKVKAFSTKVFDLLEMVKKQKDPGSYLNQDEVAGNEQVKFISPKLKCEMAIYNKPDSIVIIHNEERIKFVSDEEGALAKIQEIIDSFK